MENTIINPSEQNNLIVGDAALGRALGVSVVTINRLKKANRIPFIRIGAKYRYVLQDVLNSMKCEDYSKLTSSTN